MEFLHLFYNNFCYRVIKAEVEEQLIQMIRETINLRHKNNIVRHDFLDSVSEIFKSSDPVEDELDIVAHAASFFGDGYETSSRVS